MASSITAQGTSTTPAPSTSSSASSGCDVSTASCGAPSPGTLYLFTFLATLLLLGMVAGTIIARSVYLRRQQQRLIASGWVPPPPRRPKGELDLGQKPRIFDAHLGHALSASELNQWESLLPFSATYLSPTAPRIRGTEPHLQLIDAVSAVPSASSPASLIRRNLLSRPRRILQHTSTNTPIEPPPDPEMGIPLSEIPKVRACVAYIIAMPMEHPALGKNVFEDDKEESSVPVLELGVTEVELVRDDEFPVGDVDDKPR
ncbi:hypothetical protein B0H11DRAFT_2096121 [Mycena galericulata]|nr:hypothetical protein B0H11DRAFT_2096121 [Mycena galericulata]